ncbi:fatty acid-binding protein, liver [Triplophysa rosa]|uniref:Fatty acid-binding protein n=1 Tax=Triplophysa rosa TaxID=992332 RepID=A0A9W7TLY1_TRIRA|nr:fatty acid-binding protein, liver [Triplophysa rosa]KAI7799259.1 putative fatty acid-binding protein [Triplophysa rosa]
MAVDYSGTWRLYEQENAEEFLRAMSVPVLFFKMINEVKPITTIHHNGNEFTICVKSAVRSHTNSFIIGTETLFNTIDKKQIKATAQLMDGKIVIEMEKFTHVREIEGEDMIETITCGSAKLIRRSRRI